MKIIDRIYEYLSFSNIKPAEFERICNISNGYLSKQNKRKADIGESILKSIIENCPVLNPLWLLTGKGNMTVEDPDNIDSNRNFNELLKQNSSLIETIRNQSEIIIQLKEDYETLKKQLQMDVEGDAGCAAASGSDLER